MALKLGTKEQAFTEDVFNMDPELAAYLAGGQIEDGLKIAFRAWMMLMLDIIHTGPEALAKYDTPDDVIEAYALIYMPEALQTLDARQREIDLDPNADDTDPDTDTRPASARAAHHDLESAHQVYGFTGTDGPGPRLPRH